MKGESIDDPRVFRQRTAELLRDEARHNLLLGIVGTLIGAPDVYPDHKLFTVTDGGETVAAAVVTAPYNLIIADAANPEAIVPLVAAVLQTGLDLPGAIGNVPTIGAFVDQWRAVTGDEPRLQMRQGVFALDKVVSPALPPEGRVRGANGSDADMIRRWLAEFMAEALPHEPADDERVARALAARLAGDRSGGYWFWEVDGAPVALTGHGNPTGHGIRIGPVYTPPPHRGSGYASVLVAEQSQWLLNNGYDFCFLYTDLANPTSNAIYERIGYRQVAEAASYGF